MPDALIELGTNHLITEEQARWLTANGIPNLMTDANKKFTASVEAVKNRKYAIEHDQRLTGEAKLADVRKVVDEIVGGLTDSINGKLSTLKVKRATVLQEMHKLFHSPASEQKEHRRTAERYVASLDDEEFAAVRVKAEDDHMSPMECVLLQAAEDGDIKTVGAISESTPTWRRFHSVKPKTIDRAKDRVVKEADSHMAGELEIIEQLMRGLKSGLAASKTYIAEESGVPVGAMQEAA